MHIYVLIAVVVVSTPYNGNTLPHTYIYHVQRPFVSIYRLFSGSGTQSRQNNKKTIALDVNFYYFVLKLELHTPEYLIAGFGETKYYKMKKRQL